MTTNSGPISFMKHGPVLKGSQRLDIYNVVGHSGLFWTKSLKRMTINRGKNFLDVVLAVQKEEGRKVRPKPQ